MQLIPTDTLISVHNRIEARTPTNLCGYGFAQDDQRSNVQKETWFLLEGVEPPPCDSLFVMPHQQIELNAVALLAKFLGRAHRRGVYIHKVVSTRYSYADLEADGELAKRFCRPKGIAANGGRNCRRTWGFREEDQGCEELAPQVDVGTVGVGDFSVADGYQGSSAMPDGIVHRPEGSAEPANEADLMLGNQREPIQTWNEYWLTPPPAESRDFRNNIAAFRNPLSALQDRFRSAQEGWHYLHKTVALYEL